MPFFVKLPSHCKLYRANNEAKIIDEVKASIHFANEESSVQSLIRLLEFEIFQVDQNRRIVRQQLYFSFEFGTNIVCIAGC